MLTLVELPTASGSVFLNPKFVIGVAPLLESSKPVPVLGKCVVIQATGAMPVELSPAKAVERLTAGEFDQHDDDE